MPFGSFEAQERAIRKKEKPIVPPTESKTPKSAPVKKQADASVKVSILLVGRNMELIQEYLCSANQNMSQALHAQGMTYYTRELAAISDIVSKKKKLEQYFWTFSAEDWTYAAEAAEPRTYTFSISPSGSQGRAVDLVICCCTPEHDPMQSAQQYDACWILADGMILDDAVKSDSYAAYIAGLLPRLCGTEESAMPVSLLLSQVEKWGHFDNIRGITVFPKPVMHSLLELCRARFSACGDQAGAVSVIPVQIYGGLEYTGVSQDGQPVLHISQSGFYQSYIPDGCEVPALYTIIRLCALRGLSLEEELLHAARNHFSGKYENAGFEPARLGMEETL